MRTCAWYKGRISVVKWVDMRRTFTTRWVYNSTYDGAVWGDPPQSTGRKLSTKAAISKTTLREIIPAKLANTQYVKMEIRTGRDVPPLSLTGGNVAADEWYHFALERDVSRETLGYYINGIKSNVMDIGTEDLTNGNNTNLLSSMLDNGLGIFAAGARSGDSSANYTASFSDFMIYSDAVRSMFPAGPGLCSTPRVDNLIMWLPLDNLTHPITRPSTDGFHHRAYSEARSCAVRPFPVTTWDYVMQS